MNKAGLIALLAAAAMFVGVVYFARDDAADVNVAPPVATAPGAQAQPGAPREPASAGSMTTPVGGGNAAAPSGDPRLDVFRLSPDNGLIEFVSDAEGRVIKEVDKNPSSPSFGKVTREYSYIGSRVVALSAYEYSGEQAQVTRTLVSYHPDGRVDQFRQTTEYRKR